MAGLKDKRGFIDKDRLDLSERNAVEYWMKRWGVTRDQLVAAHRKAGLMIKDIAAELGKKRWAAIPNPGGCDFATGAAWMSVSHASACLRHGQAHTGEKHRRPFGVASASATESATALKLMSQSQ